MNSGESQELVSLTGVLFLVVGAVIAWANRIISEGLQKTPIFMSRSPREIRIYGIVGVVMGLAILILGLLGINTR